MTTPIIIRPGQLVAWQGYQSGGIGRVKAVEGDWARVEISPQHVRQVLVRCCQPVHKPVALELVRT